MPCGGTMVMSSSILAIVCSSRLPCLTRQLGDAVVYLFRFIVRGVNDDGHVTNFVETEQLIKLHQQQ